MAWYYYSGSVVKSIQVSRHKSVAVRPNTKVEILEMTQEVQAMMARGILRRTGKPLGAPSLEDQPVRPRPHLRDVLPPSAMAMHVAEKGVTSSEAMPPTKPLGESPEFTIHERELAGTDVVMPVDTGDAAVLPVEGTKDHGSGKPKRRHDH